MTTTAFTLRTKDVKWIAKHNGTTDAAGWTTIMVDATKVDDVTFCGKPWIRVDFGSDAPKDAEMALIMSPVKFMKP